MSLPGRCCGLSKRSTLANSSFAPRVPWRRTTGPRESPGRGRSSFRRSGRCGKRRMRVSSGSCSSSAPGCPRNLAQKNCSRRATSWRQFFVPRTEPPVDVISAAETTRLKTVAPERTVRSNVRDQRDFLRALRTWSMCRCVVVNCYLSLKSPFHQSSSSAVVGPIFPLARSMTDCAS